MKVSYQWLQLFFEEGALPSASELDAALTFHAFEIEGVEKVLGTEVIDVDVLPNRAADALSHRGIAHEISAILNIPMRHDPLRDAAETTPPTDSVMVTLDDDASCSFYVAAHITGVKIGESPEWLKNALEQIGQKSINNVVDATNFVLFDIGQPTHVFDAAKFAGSIPSIRTRRAKEDEKMTLLGGDEVVLRKDMTVITDADSDAPIAVAGVKGGKYAEVTTSTTDIIIEAGKFHPTQTRLTSQALKMRTDASARFENDVADTLVPLGAQAVVKLILKIAGGELQGYSYAGAATKKNDPVSVTVERVATILGASLDAKEIASIFDRLEFTYTQENNTFVVTAPFERNDIHITENLIEEIGRIYGYSNIESVQMTELGETPSVHQKFAYTEIIRNLLAENAYTEVYLYSLRDSGEVKLRNALNCDKDHLRADLSQGIRESLITNEYNMPILGLHDAVRIFEVGNVFTVNSEETHIAIGIRVTGKKKQEAQINEALSEIKEKIETVLGVELPDPVDGVLEFSMDTLLEKLPELTEYPETKTVVDGTHYSAISPYPFMLRDIAVWMPSDSLPEELHEIVRIHSGELLKRFDVFDEFEKEGRTSYAFHLVFQSMEETLTDVVVGEIMAKIEADIAAKEGWEVR